MRRVRDQTSDTVVRPGQMLMASMQRRIPPDGEADRSMREVSDRVDKTISESNDEQIYEAKEQTMAQRAYGKMDTTQVKFRESELRNEYEDFRYSPWYLHLLK
jgi:hypothetical protein